MSRHSVNVPDMFYKYIKKKAQEEGITLTDYVSKLIIKEMEKENKN